jgi:hypothetical protein
MFISTISSVQLPMRCCVLGYELEKLVLSQTLKELLIPSAAVKVNSLVGASSAAHRTSISDNDESTN